ADRARRGARDREADARPAARPPRSERLGAPRPRRARPAHLARAADEGGRARAAHHAPDRGRAAPRRAFRPVGRRTRALRRQPAFDQVQPRSLAERPMMRVRMRLLLLIGVPLLVVAVGLHYYAEGGRYVETENAYVKAHIVAVSAEVPGRVAEVAVRDNQAVSAGQFLFRLDPAPFEVTLSRARAQLAAARTDLETLRAEHRVALAETTEAEERIRFLTAQLERQARLREKGMVSEGVYDEARHNVEAARARLVAVQERTRRVLAAIGGDLKLPVEQHPRVLEAKAAVDAAALDLSRTRVSAPAAGIVSNLSCSRESMSRRVWRCSA